MAHVRDAMVSPYTMGLGMASACPAIPSSVSTVTRACSAARRWPLANSFGTRSGIENGITSMCVTLTDTSSLNFLAQGSSDEVPALDQGNAVHR